VGDGAGAGWIAGVLCSTAEMGSRLAGLIEGETGVWSGENRPPVRTEGLLLVFYLFYFWTAG
jgi:hypothetical protein